MSTRPFPWLYLAKFVCQALSRKEKKIKLLLFTSVLIGRQLLFVCEKDFPRFPQEKSDFIMCSPCVAIACVSDDSLYGNRLVTFEK